MGIGTDRLARVDHTLMRVFHLCDAPLLPADLAGHIDHSVPHAGQAAGAAVPPVPMRKNDISCAVAVWPSPAAMAKDANTILNFRGLSLFP